MANRLRLCLTGGTRVFYHPYPCGWQLEDSFQLIFGLCSLSDESPRSLGRARGWRRQGVFGVDGRGLRARAVYCPCHLKIHCKLTPMVPDVWLAAMRAVIPTSPTESPASAPDVRSTYAQGRPNQHAHGRTPRSDVALGPWAASRALMRRRRQRHDL